MAGVVRLFIISGSRRVIVSVRYSVYFSVKFIKGILQFLVFIMQTSYLVMDGDAAAGSDRSAQRAQYIRVITEHQLRPGRRGHRSHCGYQRAEYGEDHQIKEEEQVYEYRHFARKPNGDLTQKFIDTFMESSFHILRLTNAIKPTPVSVYKYI